MTLPSYARPNSRRSRYIIPRRPPRSRSYASVTPASFDGAGWTVARKPRVRRRGGRMQPECGVGAELATTSLDLVGQGRQVDRLARVAARGIAAATSASVGAPPVSVKVDIRLGSTPGAAGARRKAGGRLPAPSRRRPGRGRIESVVAGRNPGSCTPRDPPGCRRRPARARRRAARRGSSRADPPRPAGRTWRSASVSSEEVTSDTMTRVTPGNPRAMRDRHVGGEPAVDQQPPVDRFRREQQRHRHAGADRLRQVARASTTVSRVTRSVATARNGIGSRSKSPRASRLGRSRSAREAGVGVGLAHRGALEREPVLPLGPHEQRRERLPGERASGGGRGEEVGRAEERGERVRPARAVAPPAYSAPMIAPMLVPTT